MASVHRGRLAVAIATAAAVVLAAPFVGQLRALIQDTFPGQYSRIIVGAVFGSVGVAMVVALVRIRERRLLRYVAIATALIAGTISALLSRTGDATVDGVERFHFVEYGLLAFLFYRAWRPAEDASLLLLPVLAGFLTGICEEWLQWFIPARVGELHDIFLDLWAVTCGLLFSLGIDPPERLSFSLPHPSRTRVECIAALVVIAFGVFLDSVHLGYRIDDEAGVFRSTYSREALERAARERTERWRTNPPLSWTRLSREDQYLTEAITHVRRRRVCWDERNVRCAWRENLFLERYFAPVLDTPSYISPTGFRWVPEQRADAETKAAGDHILYESDADRDSPIFTWSKTIFWGAVAAAVALLLWPRRVAA